MSFSRRDFLTTGTRFARARPRSRRPRWNEENLLANQVWLNHKHRVGNGEAVHHRVREKASPISIARTTSD